MMFLAGVLVVTTVAALVQGSLGLGLALVASPALIVVDPDFVPFPVLISALIASVWTMWRDRRSGIADKFVWTLVGIPIGIPVGVLLLQVLPTAVLMLGLGLMVLVTAPLAVTASGIRPTSGYLGVGGLLSALAGTTVGLTGPTVAIVYNRLPPAVLRMTMAVYLSVVQTIAVLALVLAGRATSDVLVLAALTVPGTVLGLALSGPLARRINPRTARIAVVVVCGTAGAGLTVKALAEVITAGV